MNSQVHRVLIEGVEIYAEEDGEGSPALVFLHYWGGSRRSWSQVIATLSNRFRCIAIDLRGWGRSGRNTDDFSLLAQANDVQGVIEALKLKDFVLVGHSLGGKVAQMVAGRRLPGLRSVILVAPAPPTPLLAPEEQKKTMLTSYTTPDGIVGAIIAVTQRPLTIEQRLQMTEDSLGGAQGAKVAWLTQGMALDISDQTALINVPVCVIAGSEDRIEKEAALRAAFLPLIPNAKFEIIEGVGHLPPLEGPEEVAKAISGFIDG